MCSINVFIGHLRQPVFDARDMLYMYKRREGYNGSGTL